MSNKPIRIQRRRTKGWRMPENTVYVGRPTLYGNEYVIGEPHPDTGLPMTAQDTVDLFRRSFSPAMIAAAPRVLGGKNLACFCGIGDPCHADYLLEISNP